MKIINRAIQASIIGLAMLIGSAHASKADGRACDIHYWLASVNGGYLNAIEMNISYPDPQVCTDFTNPYCLFSYYFGDVPADWQQISDPVYKQNLKNQIIQYTLRNCSRFPLCESMRLHDSFDSIQLFGNPGLSLRCGRRSPKLDIRRVSPESLGPIITLHPIDCTTPLSC